MGFILPANPVKRNHHSGSVDIYDPLKSVVYQGFVTHLMRFYSGRKVTRAIIPAPYTNEGRNDNEISKEVSREEVR